MTDLDSAFLVRTAGVTVEHPCPEGQGGRIGRIPVLDFHGIGKLAAVIGKDQRKQLVEQILSQTLVKIVNNVNDGLRCICVPEESQHQG